MAFDVEYARWLEEQNRQINELRSAVNSHAGDAELRIIIDGIMAHYDEVFKLKSNAAKADVFHLLSGMWKTPAERCFLWLGGFRSSELLKVRLMCIQCFPYARASSRRGGISRVLNEIVILHGKKNCKNCMFLVLLHLIY